MIDNVRSRYNELVRVESSRSEQLATRMAASYGSPYLGDTDVTVGACTVDIQLTPLSPALGPKKLIWQCCALPKLFMEASMYIYLKRHLRVRNSWISSANQAARGLGYKAPGKPRTLPVFSTELFKGVVLVRLTLTANGKPVR